MVQSDRQIDSAESPDQHGRMGLSAPTRLTRIFASAGLDGILGTLGPLSTWLLLALTVIEGERRRCHLQSSPT
jgi:hypothetical protein